MLNVTNELSDIHKKSVNEEIIDEITEKLMEKLQDMVNQKVQDVLKKYQDTKNKELEKTEKQLKELGKVFNKHQSETKETIMKDIYEIKKII
jgi:glutamyl-tRNA reductase